MPISENIDFSHPFDNLKHKLSKGYNVSSKFEDKDFKQSLSCLSDIT